MGAQTFFRNFAIFSITLFILSGCKSQPEQAAQQAAPEISVAQVIQERIVESDEFTGRLQSPEKVELMPRVSGYVEKILFKEGSLVHKGDLLLTIDATPFNSEVKRLEADLLQAKAAARLAENDYTRAQQLSKQGAMSKETVDNRYAQKQQTAAQVQSVIAALDLAKLNVEYTQITAPIDGRVSYALVTSGNYVNAGQTKLTSLVSTDEMYAYFDLDEQTYLQYLNLAKEAQAHKGIDKLNNLVYMGLANEKDFPHEGEIDFIDNRINEQTGTIRMRATFKNEDQSLIPGLFTKIKLISSDAYQGILVSDKAIGTDLNNKYVLIVTKDNQLEYRPVVIGDSINGLRVIKSGLKENETIVVNGLQRVRPSMTITPKKVAMADEKEVAAIQAMQRAIDESSQALSMAKN
ncbi:MAG: efflux RND transporter periplasmic adaptor subunit [Pseudomonadota bacterium]|nr:efflux RND transporter periplasmic adaptor subunit [Alteromonas macleodii]MBK85027.1 efflux transporter periplasmic adaptor subunit [Gammaproteobacteria bacterium]MEC8009565.1 efflux RND transporter periplasmic adaptor subunit [Pseudomonadota bacterium]|tara:strand:- start:3551 stop:4771 length:1221 start_codon:yes stop_codon:yes gene_type:complete